MICENGRVNVCVNVCLKEGVCMYISSLWVKDSRYGMWMANLSPSKRADLAAVEFCFLHFGKPVACYYLFKYMFVSVVGFLGLPHLVSRL